MQIKYYVQRKVSYTPLQKQSRTNIGYNLFCDVYVRTCIVHVHSSPRQGTRISNLSYVIRKVRAHWPHECMGYTRTWVANPLALSGVSSAGLAVVGLGVFNSGDEAAGGIGSSNSGCVSTSQKMKNQDQSRTFVSNKTECPSLPMNPMPPAKDLKIWALADPAKQAWPVEDLWHGLGMEHMLNDLNIIEYPSSYDHIYEDFMLRFHNLRARNWLKSFEGQVSHLVTLERPTKRSANR